MNELSIIVPCLYSIEALPAFIDRIAVQLMSNPSDTDLIIVANQKTGAPEKIIEYVRKRYPWLKFEFLQRNGSTRSYGALARFGIAYSTSSYVVLVSPHGLEDVTLIPKMLHEIRKGVQVVQCNRFSKREDARRVHWKFRLYQVIYRHLIKILLGFKVSDSTYGYKMFDRVFVLALGLNQNGYSISPEINLKTILAGGKVTYISSPVMRIQFQSDFRLYSEGIGFSWLLIRGFLHRIGVLWF